MYYILLCTAIGLGLCILFGTIIALAGNSGTEKQALPQAPVEEAGARMFTGIGRIRVSTGQGKAVILDIVFPYNPEDRFFAEELSSKVGEFRRISADYFSSLKDSDSADLDETPVKAELLRRYNSLLRLGRIAVLYFNEYMIFD